MTLVYFDTSALVKLCVLETGTPLAVALWEGGDTLLTSRIADTEVRAVLAAAERIGRMDAASVATARARWEDLWPGLAKVEVRPELTEHAGKLVERRPLRAADAIHLASALLVKEATPLFAVWDRRLSEAARAEGLIVLPQRLG